MVQHELKTFLRAMNAYVFLFDFILCYAIYTAYFELRGISVAEIGLLIAIWSGSALVLEIWTGALSDWLDRRWLLVAAPLIKSMTFVCWALAYGNFWLYALGFLAWSTGGALYSGTREALLFERLKLAEREGAYDQYFGQMSAAESLGIGAGLLFGGFVAAVSMDASIWLSVLPLVACAFIAFKLCDVRRNSEVTAEPQIGYFENFWIALGEFRTSPDLRFVSFYIVVGLIMFEILEEFDQLYFIAVALPVWMFGIAGAIALGLRALGSAWAYRLAERRFLAWLLPSIGGLLMVTAAQGDQPIYIIVLELAYLVVVPAMILSEARFQQVIEGRSRATTTSMLYFFQNVTGLLVAIGFGFLAECVGILPAYGWAGISVLPICAWIWWRQRSGVGVFSAPPE